MTSTVNSSAGYPATAGITLSPNKLFPPTFHVDVDGKTATLEIDTRMVDPHTLCEYPLSDTKANKLVQMLASHVSRTLPKTPRPYEEWRRLYDSALKREWQNALRALDKGGESKETHTSTSETASPKKMDLPQDSWFEQLIIHTTGGHYYSPLTKGSGNKPSGLETKHEESSQVSCEWQVLNGTTHGKTPEYQVKLSYKPCSHPEVTMSLPDGYAHIVTDAFSKKISDSIASATGPSVKSDFHTSGSVPTQGLSVGELKKLCEGLADTSLRSKGIICSDVRRHQGQSEKWYDVPVQVPTNPGDCISEHNINEGDGLEEWESVSPPPQGR